MMKKEERLKRYGEAAYETRLEQMRVWREEHPDKVLVMNHEKSRKSGKYYAKSLIYQSTGLRGARERIRRCHRRQYLGYKKIIAPESQLHHQWVHELPKYSGVALVEADQHMYGFIDVIQVLEGEITLLTEEEIRNQVMD